jgi:Carboxypeptidase regulatory-like domain
MKVKTPPQLILQFIVYAVVIGVQTSAVGAQNTTTGIRGIIRDQSGAVIGQASIKLMDNATGIEHTTVSSSDGGFIIPNLQSGAYKLTASATGFQTAVYPSITVDSGRTTNVSVDLQVGVASEVVQVTASDARLDTTSNEIGTTINNKLVQNLPYGGRESLNFAGLMAGNSQANSQRNSTFNGLPNASLNISLDGMNNNSQRFKSGGTSFFSFAPARIDAIEEVTVSTTGLGAEAGGQGAMQIRLTTKRGTENYHGQILYQMRNEALNANSFFDNLAGRPRDKVRENDAVGSIGGPLLPFIPYFKGKLFFFAYYEAVPQPGTQSSTTAVLSPEAQQGIFNYFDRNGAKRSVNLLQVAAANGHTSTIDPTIAGILGSINETRARASGFLDIAGTPREFQQTMQWTQATNTETYYPTVRLDYHITPAVAWHGTWNLRNNKIAGRPPYPGNPYPFAPNQTPYQITTYVATNAVDWTIRPNMVNNATFGIQSNGEYFTKGAEPQQYSVYGNRILNIPTVNNTSLITPFVPGSGQQQSIRNNPVYQFTDNLSWVKGRHTLTLGGTMLHTTFYDTSYGSAGVPQYDFGVVASDPMNQFIRAELENINTNNNDINNALNLYALLTGRITSITIATNVDEKSKTYSQFAPVTQRFAFTTVGVYAQDSFRINPDLTLNFGLRWQFDGSIQSTNGINSLAAGPNFYGPSVGLFQPGVLSGVTNPGFVQVSNPYKRDFVNPAPNFGFAWNPSGEKGFLGKLLGDRKTVIRGAYSITFYNEGLNAISNVLSGGQGTRQNGSVTNGTNFTAGELELRMPAPPIRVFPDTFSFPIAQSAFAAPQTGNFINPNLVSPYTQNWTLGIQRQLTRNMVLEFRYVGNKATHMWHRQNLQETNIFENGFLNQFIQAKRNLDINEANGRGQTFANNNLPGQAAIPIFEAAFGRLGFQNPVVNNQGFGSATFIQNLRQGTAGTLANTIATNNTYFCRLVGNKFPACATAGFDTPGIYPINLFRANPFVGNLDYQDSNGDSNYNALQIDLRHQYANGLLLGANYTWAHSLSSILNRDDQSAGYTWYTLRNARLNYGPTPFDRRHVFNIFWTYDLPFGKGRKFSVANPVIDRVIGGWTLGGRETIASGDPVLLNGGRNTVNNLTQACVVFGEGFTPEQLQKALSSVAGDFSSTALISNIGDIANINRNTNSSQVNSALYAPASTPGQYAAFVYLRNNTSYQLDMSVNKEIRINERMRLTLRAVALNFLNHPFFALGNTSPTATSFGQITNASGNRTVQLRASFDW